jgi:BirA family transcriptional regulator, biotin operon repressor / biotin---[acetyl-CoA-carboxylase] ligase
MIDKQRIIQHLPSSLASAMLSNLFIFSQLPSTNDFLIQLPKSIPAPNQVCIALSQTAGRGQYNRNWLSPIGKNIYFSQRLCMPNMPVVSGITLVVGIILCQILRELTDLPCLVKWPNDIFLANKKLAGILTEVIVDPSEHKYLVVGIGLNVEISVDLRSQLPNATDLAAHQITFFDTNRFIAKLITGLDHGLPHVMQNGWSDYYHLWHQYDALWQKSIRVKTINDDISGIAQGITETGHLQLWHQGHVKQFASGEASIII